MAMADTLEAIAERRQREGEKREGSEWQASADLAQIVAVERSRKINKVK